MKVTLTNIDGVDKTLTTIQEILKMAQYNFDENEEQESPLTRPTTVAESIGYLTVFCGGTFPQILIEE